MRAAVLNPLGERRRGRRAHTAPRTPSGSAAADRTDRGGTARQRHAAAGVRADRRNHAAAVSSHDRASYACHCGLLFEAPVTTTVACPNCGAAQAW